MIEASASLTVDEAATVFARPEAYADEPYFHAATALLRAQRPFALCEVEGYPSFTAVTRHTDVYDISTHHNVWRVEPRVMLQHLAVEEAQRKLGEMRSVVNLDDPRHRQLRAITADWFKPGGLEHLDERIRLLARRAVDRMAEHGEGCDFARDIAMPFPLEVILSLLGLPESDFDRMQTLTQEMFGSNDPEFARGEPGEGFLLAMMDIFGYFSEKITAWQAEPTNDLGSLIANAKVDGQPIELLEQLSYYAIIATAGHDTTAASMSGAMRAFAENPDQWLRLQADPGLVPSAVEEVFRWVTPVKSFMRNAVAPYDVGGHHFEPGDAVLLSYWSANRDESVFVDPQRFDVGREPNRHLAFGFGKHYCLGAVLARMELTAMFEELIPRLEHIELAGEPRLSAAVAVSGLKRLPVSYRLR
jgi:cytochrome P450